MESKRQLHGENLRQNSNLIYFLINGIVAMIFAHEVIIMVSWDVQNMLQYGD